MSADLTAGRDGISAHSATRVRRPLWFWLGFYMFVDRLNLLAKFQSLRVAYEERLASIPDDVPLIVVMNHPSWWDPVPVMEVKFNALPHRSAYYPTESKALQRASHLRRIGSFPLFAGSVGGTRTLIRDCQYALSLPGSMLVFTPEGKFTDPRKRPLELHRGISSLLSRLKRAVVIPLALEYTLWGGQRMEILTCWGEPVPIEDGSSKSTNEWHAVITASLTQTLDELAEISINREAWKFRTLVHGKLGPRNLKKMVADARTLYRYRRPRGDVA